MAIKAGDRMPTGTFKTKTKDGIQDVSTDQLFKGKKVVLFSVPGAFTPTCDAKHLPGFVEKAADIKAKGIDTIKLATLKFILDGKPLVTEPVVDGSRCGARIPK